MATHCRVLQRSEFATRNPRYLSHFRRVVAYFLSSAVPLHLVTFTILFTTM